MADDIVERAEFRAQIGEAGAHQAHIAQTGGWLLRIAGRTQAHIPVRAGDLWWSVDRSVPGVTLLFVAGRGFALPAVNGAVCVEAAGGEHGARTRVWWTLAALR